MAVDVTPVFESGEELATQRFATRENAQEYIRWVETAMEAQFGPTWADGFSVTYRFEEVEAD